jgi:Gpi18-like mannosyltransferase
MMAMPWRERIRSRCAQLTRLFPQARQKWRCCEVYLSALLIFAASRLVVIVGVNFGRLLVPISDSNRTDVGPAWYDRLLRWDSEWYAAIVSHGYRYSDDPSAEGPTVFYPLYPLLTYVIKSLFGIDQFVALLLVANTAALAAALLMTKFVKNELGDETALLSLALFCFFPSSLFLSAGYTESLYLVFVLLSFILMSRKKFAPAAAMAGLSLATRSIGIVMIPVILWEMARVNILPWPRLLLKMALCGVLAASGLLVYMAYLGIAFGHPLAFVTVEAAWHDGTFLDRFVSAVTLAGFQHANPWATGWFLCFLALSIWSFWRLRFAVSLYALGALAVPYLTLGITDSMSRYVLVCFPAFMGMGILCKGRPWLLIAIIGIFAALLLQTAAMFSQWYWVA